MSRIAIVVHALVPHDPRVRRQSDALLAAGHEVDIFALRASGQPGYEERDGLRIHRLPIDRTWHGMVGHLAEYLAFMGIVTVVLARQHRRRRYALLQVATVPDFLVVAGVPLRLAGVPVLLDLHEDMPTFYLDRFSGLLHRPLVALVAAVARGSAALADELITVHEPLRRLSLERGVAPERITVVMNSADEAVFDPARVHRRAFMEDGELRLMHHSNLQRVYGLDRAIEAVALLGDLPLRFDVYGDGPYRPAIEEAIRRAEVGDRVVLHGAVPQDELPQLIAGSDIGLVPTLPEPYADYSLSTKLLEYAAMGLPIVATELATFRAHFTDSAIRFVSDGGPSALAAAIRADVADPEGTTARGQEARRQARSYAWSAQRQRYLEVVERLLATREPDSEIPAA
jgi:glycosyltransferase involved in cell wall biosynthesis